jgi:hypothetical protein
MNERIKQLLGQAYDEAVPETWTTLSAEQLGRIHEKFAELIVRECCQYLDNEAERLYGLSGSEVDPVFQSNFEICAEKCYDNSQGLKEHFGVEA